MKKLPANPWALVRCVAGVAALRLVFAGWGPSVVEAAAPSGTGDPLAELAFELSQGIHGHVEPSELRWEPSSGWVQDIVWGRGLLFLGKPSKDSARDVYRARVRVSPWGSVLGVGGVHNLTLTPLGDDHALVLRGHRAAFATRAFEQEQSVTVYDLDGDRGTFGDDWSRAFMGALSNVESTGTLRGLERVEGIFLVPSSDVGLKLEGDELRVTLRDGQGHLHEERLQFLPEGIDSSPGIRAERTGISSKRFIHWMVDSVRAIDWIGPAPIARLEEAYFGARDTVRRWTYAVKTEAASPAGSPVLAGSIATPQTAKEATQGRDPWPPSPVPAMLSDASPDEGQWRDPNLPWIRRLSLSAPSPFLVTTVRPDEQRPYVTVTFVAMDPRQLELRMEAGAEDPKPLTGGHGLGHIPRDGAMASRVVGAFNGAFKTEHGSYGMMVQRRVLLPPQVGAATVMTLKDGRIAFGTWPQRNHGGFQGFDDEDIDSLRQNLDPLVDEGRINPSKRMQWGFTLPGTGMQTERSGLCVTGEGILLYAWGDDLNAGTLAKAMNRAGCVYGMHLDMNPHHTGFSFLSIEDSRRHKFRAELVSKDMSINADRYVEYSAKDFFYLVLRNPAPSVPEGALWDPSPGVQPSPSWAPSVWSRGRLDATGFEMMSFDLRRVQTKIRAGTGEPDLGVGAGASPATELSPDDERRVMGALGLGVSLPKPTMGLVIDGRRALLRSHEYGGATAWLLARADGAVSIVGPEEIREHGPRDDAVELPLLVHRGAQVDTRTGGEEEGMKAGLGLTSDGRAIWARTRRGLTDLATLLREAGCVEALRLDRGSLASGRAYRPESGDVARIDRAETVVFFLDKAMGIPAFRFRVRDGAPAEKTHRGPS